MGGVDCFLTRMKINAFLLIASFAIGAPLFADVIVAPATPTSNVAADAGSTLAGLVSGTQLSASVLNGSDATAALGVTHTSGTLANSYVSAQSGADYFALGTAPAFTFTFGTAVHDINSIIVWNYASVASGNAAPNNATKTFNLQFFSDAAATVSLGSETGFTLARSLGGSTTVEQVAQRLFFSGGGDYDGVRAIRMTLTDNYAGQAGGAGGDRVGLAEVRFTAVPEASTYGLLGAGALAAAALVRRRRAR